LEDGLVDVWQEVKDTVGDPIFQQVGAKIHTARDTMAWLAENSIQVMEWPVNFPDLNPNRHCWQRVKEKLHQRFPNIHKTKRGPDTVKGHLAEALNQVWAQDNEGEFLERFWESLSNKVAAVLDARGSYTKYGFFCFIILYIAFLMFIGCLHIFSFYSKQLWLKR